MYRLRLDIAKDAKFLHADNEDTDQSVRMRRLIWIFPGRTCLNAKEWFIIMG